MRKTNMITVLVCFLFLSGISFGFLKGEIKTDTMDENPVINSQEDFVITLDINQTAIGKDGGALANLTLDNQGIDPVSDVYVDFGFIGEFAEFSSSYPQHQEVLLINPGASSTLNIEVVLNSSIDFGSHESQAADVCLVFDVSGSMGNEIDSVKAEFLDIVANLTSKIASLRIGAMIYGCSRYSEYPQEHPSNYIEFTDDFNAVDDFISDMIATGGVEPWGDALYLANSWGWREDIPKILIIVGDEDCDPGHIVGVGSTTDYYNGSQLVDVVTNLKEKDVIINSIYTGESGIVVNQFTWIAEYTGGECVDLVELQQSEDPMDIPELIESWTLSLTREYFVYLYANVSWTELALGGPYDYSTQESLYVLIDIAPPSITVSYLINEELDGEFFIDISITPKDISGILTAGFYWTFDDLTGGPEPTWHFTTLTDPIGDTYVETFTDLEEGERISFYIIAIDNMNNIGQTWIYNVTIIIEPKTLGSTTSVVFLSDGSTKKVYFDMDVHSTCYLWMETKESITVDFAPMSDFTFSEVYSDENGTIFSVQKLSSNTILEVILSGDTTEDAIELNWNTATFVLSANFPYNQWTLDSEYTNILINTTVTSSDTGFLAIIMYSSELIVVAHVYNDQWEKMGKVIPGKPLELATGTYFVWVERIIRDGYFGLYFGEDPPLEDDPYYELGVTKAQGVPMLAILPIILMSLGLLTFIGVKRRKVKEEAK